MRLLFRVYFCLFSSSIIFLCVFTTKWTYTKRCIVQSTFLLLAYSRLGLKFYEVSPLYSQCFLKFEIGSNDGKFRTFIFYLRKHLNWKSGSVNPWLIRNFFFFSSFLLLPQTETLRAKKVVNYTILKVYYTKFLVFSVSHRFLGKAKIT